MNDISPQELSAVESPLTIGVSGHRNPHPELVDEVRARVGAFFDLILAQLRETQVHVIVGMAAGADLLVAEAALERNLTVQAVLPMPLERYADDFDAESLSLLQNLLRHPAVACIVLPEDLAELPSAEALRGKDRDELYANLTRYLAQKCNLLLALWDGKPSAQLGGTADTVLRYLGARTEHASEQEEIVFVDAATETAWGHQFVYWIPTPRSTEVAPALEAPCFLTGAGANLLRRHDSMPHDLAQQLSELDAYNADFARLRGSGDIAAPDTLMTQLPADVTPADRAALSRIDAEYGKADALAVFFQKRSDRLFRWSSYMASAMGLLFLVYAKLHASNAFLLTYLTLLVLGFGLFYWFEGRHWFAKHLVYRVLAETMRTRFFLRLAGVDHLVDADDLIRLTGINQFTGFSWIINIFKGATSLRIRSAEERRGNPLHLSFVRSAWIDHQQNYFRRKVAALEGTLKSLHQTKRALLMAILALALTLAFFGESLEHKLIGGEVTVKDWIIFFIGLLPVWLGIWEIYQNKMATRELLWQYRNQLAHFSRANLQLRRSPVWGHDTSVLVTLGKESLMEIFLWAIHRYHREHEPPAAA